MLTKNGKMFVLKTKKSSKKITIIADKSTHKSYNISVLGAILKWLKRLVLKTNRR